jgi:general secretion pathway protein L
VFALSDLIKKHGLEFNEAYCALPGLRSIARILTLPFSSRRRLEQILPFELENVVPFDLEEMHLSFDVLGKDPAGGFRILAALTPKSEVVQFLQRLAMAGVDPKIVDVAPHALFTAARRFLPDEFGAYALIDLGATHVDVAALSAGELVDLRSIPFGGERFDRELARALRIDEARAEQVKIEKADLAASDPVGAALRAAVEPLLIRLRQTLQGIRAGKSIEITRAYLTGRGSLLRGLDALLAQELAIEVSPLTPLTPELTVAADPHDPAQQARFAAAMALVHRGFGTLRGTQLNLRHGPFVYKRQQLAIRSSLRSLSAVGAIVLLLLAYNVIASQLQKRRQLAAVQDQITQLYLKAFPGSPPPVLPLEQFRSQIDKTMAKERTIGFFGDANLRAIDILKAMSEGIPPMLSVDIKKFDLTTDALRLEGEVPSFPDVDQLEKALQQCPAFKQVKKESSSSTAGDRIKFKFLINLVDQKKAKLGAAPGRPGVPAGAPAAPLPAAPTGTPGQVKPPSSPSAGAAAP